MLSYVIPAKEENGSNKNQVVSSKSNSRNVNLNLPLHNLNEEMYEHQETDFMLANVPNNTDFCNELTHLIRSNEGEQSSPNTIKKCYFNNNTSMDGGNPVILSENESFDDFDNSLLESDASLRQVTETNKSKKTKHCKAGAKTVGLKRVSFGSSKGSMVETLVFETPTPLSELPEPSFESIGRSKSPNRQIVDDSGIELQEDLERSVVRVSIYQSSKPQQISQPEFLTKLTENLEESFSSYSNNLDNIMTSAIPGYDRQQSTDSGWDNPFRPGGDLSREAEEIVNMIKGGKPITPTEEEKPQNGQAHREEEHQNGKIVTESVNKTKITQEQSTQNGSGVTHSETKLKPNENNGVTTSVNQVSKQVVPGPTSASHVVIDEKKNKKKGCCVLQ